MPQHHLFWSLTQARVVISDRKDHYNNRRRHSSLRYLARPSTLRAALTDEQLSPNVEQFSGSGQLDGEVPSTAQFP